ncbi:unnamed protein product [Darwinula stevensoni]|uniref:Peroxisomal membrane protein 11C n=1 Tax=Darwinula stevensoni TaxID=69355 RepID=A0A7R9ACJ5_9CRUS|nr:unnamed protein product [Darwinula stevensoni]CAG0900239.1 unnamed protein product [Darwinula stevensoni]
MKIKNKDEGLRLGSNVESMKGIPKTLDIKDPVMRVLSFVAQISQAGYLSADHMAWLGQVGLVRVNTSRCNRFISRCWLVLLLANIGKSLYELYGLYQLWAMPPKQRWISPGTDFLAFIQYVTNHHRTLVVDLLRNAFDLPLPLSSLGKLDMSPSMVGLFGTISSLLGLNAFLANRIQSSTKAKSSWKSAYGATRRRQTDRRSVRTMCKGRPPPPCSDQRRATFKWPTLYNGIRIKQNNMVEYGARRKETAADEFDAEGDSLVSYVRKRGSSASWLKDTCLHLPYGPLLYAVSLSNTSTLE